MDNKKIVQSKIEFMDSEGYRIKKEERLKELREKVIQKQPKTVAEYFAIANSVFAKDRINSREKINKIIAEKKQNKSRKR